MNDMITKLLGLGADSRDLTSLQMALRALVVFVVTIITVRVGQKRFLGRNSALDFVLAVTLGSVESRAINGSAPFVPTLIAGFVLVGVYWLPSFLALHSHRLGKLVKGHATTLIEGGEVQQRAMRQLLITQDDLLEDLRTCASVTDPAQVKVARLERGGQLSVIREDAGPKVLDVQVKAGVLSTAR